MRSSKAVLVGLIALLSPACGVAGGWTRVWKLDSKYPNVSSTLTITGKLPKLHFVLDAYSGGNMGGIDGDLVVKGDRAQFESEENCKLAFRRRGDRLTLEQDGSCGAGVGVGYAGEYVPEAVAASRPRPDLLSLEVLETRAQDAAARKLLKRDYRTLVQSIHITSDGEDLDHLGAKVMTSFVRGIAGFNDSILMFAGTKLWVGIMVHDAKNQLRVRYYTNQAAWKKRLPKTIEAWHASKREPLPIDMMR